MQASETSWRVFLLAVNSWNRWRVARNVSSGINQKKLYCWGICCIIKGTDECWNRTWKNSFSHLTDMATSTLFSVNSLSQFIRLRCLVKMVTLTLFFGRKYDTFYVVFILPGSVDSNMMYNSTSMRITKSFASLCHPICPDRDRRRSMPSNQFRYQDISPILGTRCPVNKRRCVLEWQAKRSENIFPQSG